MAGNNIHSQIVDSTEIHVPKGFTEANNGTVAIKNANGQLEWVDVDDVSSKSNIDSLVNPTENDDSSLDYSVGSRWINTVQKIAYICLDASVGAAIWRPLIRNNGSAVVDPTVTDDLSKGYFAGSIWINVADGREAWLCTDNAIGAAEWKSVTSQDVVGFDHRTLSHLDSDDHLQYLNRDGSRPMTAELDMDGNAIINVPEINGFTVPGHNVRHVKLEPGTAEYSSIAAAAASITDSSASNPYVIFVGPGEFTEPSFTVPTHVHIVGSGIDVTVVSVATPNTTFITVDRNTAILNMTITGATGASGVLIDFVPSGIGTRLLLQGLRFGNSETVFRCVNPDFDCTLNILNCGTIRTDTFKTVFKIESNTGMILGLINGGTYLQSTNDSQASTFNISGTAADITILSLMSRFPVGAAGTHLMLYDGARVTVNGFSLEGGSVGLDVPNVGAGPTLNANGVISFTPTSAANLVHPGFNGAIQGNASVATSIIDPAVTDISLIITDPNGNQYISGQLNTRQPDGEFIDTTTLSVESSAVGLLASGAITPTGGRNVEIAPGLGYLQRPDSSLRKIEWTTTPLLIPADSTKFIYVDEDSVIQTSNTLPNTRETVFLGRVVSNTSSIVLIDASGFSALHVSNAFGDMLRESIGAIYVSGSNVTELGTRTLDVTAGDYYFGELNYVTQGDSPIQFTSFYGDGGSGFIHVPGETVVDNAFYDDGSGTLAPLTSGYYVKHSLYVVGTCTGGFANEGYYLVYGQAEYPDLAVVEQAALPSAPPFLNDGVTLIASIIVQEGFTNIVQIRDERPITSARRTSTVAASTFHHNLVGLDDFDDHLRYLPVDGSRPMEADLPMGGFDITGAGLVNGVTVEDHSDRHRPSGADAIPTAAAATQNPDQANAEGTTNFLARADHVHNIPTAVAIGMGANTSNAQGVSTSFSRADHQHAIASGTPVSQTPDQTNATGTSNNFARADHVHNIPTAVAVGITGNTVNGQGVASTFSRSDHTHFLLTGAPSTQIPDQANATGTAAAMARADHIHNIPADAPTTTLSPATTNAEGTGSAFARNDHTHAVATALVADITTIQPDATASAGTADTFARGDHRHAIDAAAPVAQIPNQANAEGSSTSFARADHVHNIAADAPTTTLSPATTNAEGVGTAFARNDHTHAVATGLVGDITTIQPDATASAGTVDRFARADHRHAIDAATAVTISATTANAEGVSTSFARADHTHAISTGAPSTQTPDQANATGTSANLARADHIHNIPAAIATTISSNANAKGVSTAFALADHTHQLTAATANLDHVPQFDGSAWQATYPELLLDLSRASRVHEDWVTGTVAGVNNWVAVVNGGGSAVAIQTATALDSNHPGVVGVTGGNAANRHSTLVLSPSRLLGGGALTVTVLFQISTTTNATFRIGLGDSNSNTDHNNGVYLEYNSATSANWLIKTANAGTRTSTTTSTAATANTWHKLVITVNAAATSVSYTLNGVSLGSIATNIPTTNSVGGSLVAVSTAGTSSTLYVDYYTSTQRFTTPR